MLSICNFSYSRSSVLFLIAIILFSSQLDAQILRVNRPNAITDSTELVTGFISLDMSMNNGNSTAEQQVKFTSFQSAGDLAFTTTKHVYYVIGDINYFKSTGGPLLSTGYLHLRSNLLRKRTLSYEVFTQGQYDQGRRLKERYLLGAGTRWRILDELALGTAIMQEYEEWRMISDEESTVVKSLTKFSSYLTGKVNFTENMALSLTGYYQTGYDPEISSFRNRVSGDAALEIKIGARLSFRMRYVIAYEEKPIIAISKTVYSFSNGIMYEF